MLQTLEHKVQMYQSKETRQRVKPVRSQINSFIGSNKYKENYYKWCVVGRKPTPLETILSVAVHGLTGWFGVLPEGVSWRVAAKTEWITLFCTYWPFLMRSQKRPSGWTCLLRHFAVGCCKKDTRILLRQSHLLPLQSHHQQVNKGVQQKMLSSLGNHKWIRQYGCNNLALMH